MSATTMSPAWISAGGSTRGSLGAASVTVRPASMAGPIGLGESADEEHRHVHAALYERARDDEAVAPVVAAAAEDGHLALGEIAVHRLHGRDGLPAGVLHEDERRDADVVDRAAIGLPHLRRIQYTHLRQGHKGNKGHKGYITGRLCVRPLCPTTMPPPSRPTLVSDFRVRPLCPNSVSDLCVRRYLCVLLLTVSFFSLCPWSRVCP